MFFSLGHVVYYIHDCPSSSLFRDQASSAKSSQLNHRKIKPNKPVWPHFAQRLVSFHQQTMLQTPVHLLTEGRENYSEMLDFE